MDKQENVSLNRLLRVINASCYLPELLKFNTEYTEDKEFHREELQSSFS